MISVFYTFINWLRKTPICVANALFHVYVGGGGLDGGGGPEFGIQLKKIVLIRDSISEISP